MRTIVFAQNRKLGVDWLTQNVPVTPQERRRTQTEILYRNGDVITSITRYEQVRTAPKNAEDRAIIVGTVEESSVNQLINGYKSSGINLNVEAQGQVLTTTEIKRRALLEQMEDLEREDRLQTFFKTLTLEGIRITKTDINVSNRQFNVSLSGRFT